MRNLFLTAVLGAGVLVSGCSMMPWSSAPSSPSSSAAASCEVASVPHDAVFGVRQGVDIATWPAAVPRGPSGCQRVWYGQRAHPEAMQVMATYHYRNGKVERLTGRVPNGASYDCYYRDGALETQRSQNAGQCPKASELQ